MNKMEDTGINLVQVERHEQQFKHGYTIESDVEHNKEFQLQHAAVMLINGSFGEKHVPKGWDAKRWAKMKRKPYIKRLQIAAAWLCAEIDRMKAIEKKQIGKTSVSDFLKK